MSPKFTPNKNRFIPVDLMPKPVFKTGSTASEVAQFGSNATTNYPFAAMGEPGEKLHLVGLNSSSEKLTPVRSTGAPDWFTNSTQSVIAPFVSINERLLAITSLNLMEL